MLEKESERGREHADDVLQYCDTDGDVLVRFDKDSGATDIIIPEAVTEIGEFAFSGCEELKAVVIPRGVKRIGRGAFCGCRGLRSVNIPRTVEHIGAGAFDGCGGLTKIDVEKGNIKYYAENGCLIEAAAKKVVRGCAKSVIPSDVAEIGRRAFDGCVGLAHFEIPNGVTCIGGCAFFGCSELTEISVPSSGDGYRGMRVHELW